MNEMPLNEGQEKVAAFRFDLQRFAEGSAEVGDGGGGDVGNADTGASVDENTDSEVATESNDIEETVDSESVEQNETPGQTPEANAAFARLRKEKEAAEKAAQRAKEEVQREKDAWYAEQFGESHGIFTEAQYRQAIVQQKKQAEEQARQQALRKPQEVYDQLIAEGYDPKVAALAAKDMEKEIKLAQLEQKLTAKEQAEKQQKQDAAKDARAKEIVSDHSKLVKEFGKDVIPDIDSLDADVVRKLQSGYSLYDAWISSNLDFVREHAKKAGTAKALKNVNSKAHLQSEKDGGGDFGTEVSLTADQLRVWKAMGYNEKEARKRAAKYAKRGK